MLLFPAFLAYPPSRAALLLEEGCSSPREGPQYRTRSLLDPKLRPASNANQGGKIQDVIKNVGMTVQDGGHKVEKQPTTQTNTSPRSGWTS